jgi:hypothetical protein
MRDRDVRNAIQAALLATDAFDGVWIWGLPEDYGTASSQGAAAAITPMNSRQEDIWDAAATGGLIITSRIAITLLYRHPDPQIRDEGAELLLDMAANALNGQGLGGLIFPQTAHITAWDWQPPAAPERRIQTTFTYQYNVEGWDSYDATQ